MKRWPWHALLTTAHDVKETNFTFEFLGGLRDSGIGKEAIGKRAFGWFQAKVVHQLLPRQISQFYQASCSYYR